MSSEEDKKDWGKSMSEIHQVSLMLGRVDARLDNIEKEVVYFRKEMGRMNTALTNARVKVGGVTIGLSILATILINVFLKLNV